MSGVIEIATQIITQTMGVMVGTSAQQIYACPVSTAPVQPRAAYIRVWNVAAPGGGTVWLTRSAAVGLNVAANAPGCFPLGPGQFEVFQIPQAIPLNPLWAIATEANTPLTIEIG
jgi:hypothetical protein